MMLYASELWRRDLDVILDTFPEIGRLNGKSVMITGAAGLICSAITDLLIRYNEIHGGNIQILAAGRWPEEMSNRFGGFLKRDYFHYVRYDASKSDNHIEEDAEYIIHGASNAFPSMIVKEPVETILANVTGLKHLLDYAKEHRTKRVLYISSSEVYGLKQNDQPYKENEYGYIDVLNSRSSYSIGKRAAETLCASYADEYAVESVIVRPGHIYGPTASSSDNRVGSAWAYAVAQKKDIVMKSDGSQIRSYCYCLDCASAILKVLLDGENCHAYNISNPDSVISIAQMAHLLATAGRVRVEYEIPTENDKKGFNPMPNSSLDSTSLLKLGWHGCFDAETGLRHTVDILKEKKARVQ